MRQNIFGVIGEIDSLPGCTQIAVSHSVYLPVHPRGSGVGKSANSKRKQIVFDELGYDMMICTVDRKNETQRHILIENGWRCVTAFLSRKTGNAVELWCCSR